MTPFADLVVSSSWRGKAICTKQVSRLATGCSLGARRSSGRRCGGGRLRRVLETHAFPRSVLLKGQWRDGMVAVFQLWSGSVEGQRAGIRARVVGIGGREGGCPIKGLWLPGVVRTMPRVLLEAGVSDEQTGRLAFIGHCWRARPMMAPVRRRAHPPSSLCGLEEADLVEGLFPRKHVIDGASDARSENGDGFGLSVLSLVAGAKALAV